ncbi:MAG: hypothetical protein D6820_13515 [Lentisphaerae bacterium]|nr:MAG: hypothetical protein D6820_13515 [Lentisphaerota bacterium]
MLDYLPSGESWARARAAALKALELDETMSDAHLALGLAKLHEDWDWPGAEKAFKRARELNPHSEPVHSYHALYYLVLGKIEASLAEAREALALDPISPGANLTMAVHLLRANHLSEAEEQIQKTLELIPDHPFAHYLLGQVYMLQGRHAHGIAQLEKSLRLSGRTRTILAALGWAHGLTGNEEKARTFLTELEEKSQEEYVSPVLFARIYAALKDFDRAFQYLEKAYEAHDSSSIHIKTEESIQNLRSDPRFTALLRKMGLEGK